MHGRPATAKGRPSGCPAPGAARCALRCSRLGRPCPPRSGLRPSLHVSSPSLRGSVCASAPRPPPRLRSLPLRAAAPAGRTGSGAGAARAAGRRAWAEPGAEARGGGREPGCRARGEGAAAAVGRRREAETWGEGTGRGMELAAGAATQSPGAKVGTGVTEAGAGKAGSGTRRAGRGRSSRPRRMHCQPSPRPRAHVSAQPATASPRRPCLRGERGSQPRAGAETGERPGRPSSSARSPRPPAGPRVADVGTGGVRPGSWRPLEVPPVCVRVAHQEAAFVAGL